MRRIAVINQKGGVGKTTTAANLGAALASLGRSVVLVDLDPQANLSVHLGIDAPEGIPSIYQVLLADRSFGEIIRPTSTPRLSIAPANLDLSGAEIELVSVMGRETRLRDALEEWLRADGDAPRREDVDFLIIDSPPSLGLLSVNGLVAVDEVFIAVQTEFFALRGLTKLLELVELVKRRLNPTLEISGIVAGLFDARRNLAREVLAELRAFFGAKVFKTVIRENVRLAEAPSHGKSIFEYAPDSNGAEDYLALAKEVLGIVDATAAATDGRAVEAATEAVRPETSELAPDPVVSPSVAAAPDPAVPSQPAVHPHASVDAT